MPVALKHSSEQIEILVSVYLTLSLKTQENIMHRVLKLRYFMNFCVKLNKTASTEFAKIREVYKDHTTSRSIVLKKYLA